MAIVEAVGITKRFDGVTALDGIDLKSGEGEFLVFLGPSGCGKTTLLRIIAGLEQQTEGDVRIGGRAVNELPPRARRIAMVFQSYALYPHKTVYQNIEFPLKAQGMAKSERAKKVQWAAEMFGITRHFKRRPRELSGGERQRVALARALVRDPDVFLLDEPLSNLDAKLRAQARDELLRFQRRVKTTTIYVTHDQVEAMGMGDRIAVMNDGKLNQLGTPKDIYYDPSNTFVAGFLGSPPMNLVKGEDFVLGFRPENFLPREAHNGEDVMVLPLHLSRIELLGADRLLYGELAGGAFDGQKAIAKMSAKMSVAAAPGQTHEFAVPRGDLRSFDKATGARIEPGAR